MKTLGCIAIVVFLIGGLVWFILIGYRLAWTGFSTKTLWDWMQILLVPLMLAIGGLIGGFWFNQIQKNRDERATEQRGEIAADNQQEASLQAYLDKMSELLLEKKLRDSAAEDEVQKIARVRTLTVLRGLDPIRKASVIQFLHESGLIDKDKCIINLSGADLSGAKLWGITLSGANFNGAELRGANLGGANLSGANLNKATLWNANFNGAELRGANLGGADLTRANLSSTDLSGADLSEATFIEADLHWANLTGANLRGALLCNRANLSEANLSGADLSRANFNEAVLWRANLKGAIGATFEGLEMQAASLEGATMPDGSKHS